MQYQYKRLRDQLHADIDHDCTMYSKGFCKAYDKIDDTIEAFELEQTVHDGVEQ